MVGTHTRFSNLGEQTDKKEMYGLCLTRSTGEFRTGDDLAGVFVTSGHRQFLYRFPFWYVSKVAYTYTPPPKRFKVLRVI
mmetsp:Transcript_25744/g.26144  ORF Transcript_25744/g.26144 Transcript_25744/m.26144 type:complete len:80 (-) Transcript_25744:315-554(-)